MNNSDLLDETPVIEPSVEELIREFSYKIPPTALHDQLLEEFRLYEHNAEEFMRKKNRRAGLRARQSLRRIFLLCVGRRREINKQKHALGKYEW